MLILGVTSSPEKLHHSRNLDDVPVTKNTSYPKFTGLKSTPCSVAHILVHNFTEYKSSTHHPDIFPTHIHHPQLKFMVADILAISSWVMLQTLNDFMTTSFGAQLDLYLPLNLLEDMTG